MALQLIVTNAGRAALVNAENTGTAPVLIAQLGLTATAVTPQATATTLPGEFKRIAGLSGASIADDTIHMIARDNTSDTYTVRAFALYLADGTLFALYGQAAPLLEKAAASSAMFMADVRFVDLLAADLTFGDVTFLNPPATETVQGVAELATQAESDAGIDDQRIVTPKKARASFLTWATSMFADVWRASNDGAGSGMDADLLDGQQGSWYSNIIARLGYIPASQAGDIFSGTVRVRVAGNGYVELVGSPGGDTGVIHFSGNDGVRKGYIYVPIAGAMVYGSDTGAGHKFIGGQLWRDGFAVWDAAIDGAGSGMDADMLDGHHATAFDRIVQQNLSAIDGYEVYASGKKECWTTLTVPADGAVTWSLPIEHSSWINPVISMSIQNGEINAQQTVGVVSASLTSVTVYSAVNYPTTIRVQTKGV